MPQIKDIAITKAIASDSDLLPMQSPSGETYIITKANLLKGLSSESGSISKTAKFWRVRNLVQPSGTDRQWIVREFGLLDSAQIALAPSIFSASKYIASAYKAADNNTTTWWDGSGQDGINQWLGYEFVNPVTPVYIKLWNLNLYGNVPPTLFSLDSSLNNSEWNSVFTFPLTTTDTPNLLAIP
ncbi:hypothetical protein LC605_30110 [Nostoc sp. CHAB 5836]|uniref:hypothetical protein n=1 Tax=Nostoc sp. CHAB 5836 TaxID=2780404 RepID=UPI001E385C0D|nr:hypothetical protein [Nostoc sp. CHAB 5836]MCC5619252.1 hypothetical protein [Nostoc sp. CHAB 5836]